MGFPCWKRCQIMLLTKTYMAKPGEVEAKWWLVDATDKVVGRLASDIAMILMGKHRPTYTPHVDTGDFVVVINADKVVFTGKKWQQKEYTWYTGYPRQRRKRPGTAWQRRPESILSEAVRRMLPKNKLAFKMLDKLKIYAGDEHPHQAQQPAAERIGHQVTNIAVARRTTQIHEGLRMAATANHRRHPGHRPAQDVCARVRVRPGRARSSSTSGRWKIFLCILQQNAVLAPLEQTGMRSEVDVLIRVNGGGITGQADACKLGIARALKKYREDIVDPLRDSGLLTRDGRMKERKKYGLRGARRGTQFSKR